MTNGPRVTPFPIILHVDGRGSPVKLAEASAIYVPSLSAVTFSATTITAENWVNLPNLGGVTSVFQLDGTGVFQLTGESPNLSAYVLSSTNLPLSSLVFNLQSSASEISSVVNSHLGSSVHWTQGQLDSRYVLTGVNSVLSTTVTDHLGSAVHWTQNQLTATYVLTSTNSNLSSAFNSHIASAVHWTQAQLDAKYVLTGVNSSLSTVVTDHIGSAVHWDTNTLDARFINASGDTSLGAFVLSSVSAATYLNLPSSIATWNANRLQGNLVHTATPGIGEILAWDNSNSRWTPSAVPFGGVTNNPGGSTGDFQFKNGTSFSGTSAVVFNSTTNTLNAAGISATQYFNLPSVTSLNGTGVFVTTAINSGLSSSFASHIADTSIHFTSASLTGVFSVTSHTHTDFVLTATNSALSSTVANHLASAVHWDANTLDSRFINASGDSSNGPFYFSSLSATTFSATTYLNLPSVTALNGTGVFETTGFSRQNFVLTSTNNVLSTTVSNHIASAVHWDANTLDSRFINASGDSSNGPFYFSSLSATTFSATTYRNLPSVTSLDGTGIFSLTSHNHAVTSLTDVLVTSTPSNGQVLTWSSTKWIASSVVGGGAVNYDATAIRGVPVCATLPSRPNQLFVYDSTAAQWKAGLSIFQSSATPSGSVGVDGDIYFQYNVSTTLSGLDDTLITSPSLGQVLAWNSSKWVPSSVIMTGGGGGATPAAPNYAFQFYNNGNLSANSGFGFDPNTYVGGSLSSTLPLSHYAWMYVDQSLGLGNYIQFYGASGSGFLQNAGNMAAVSSNALLATSLSGVTISATTYRNLPSGVAAWNASKLLGENITYGTFGGLADTDFLIYFGGGPYWVNVSPSIAATVLGPIAAYNATQLQSVAISNTAPATNQVLTYNGTSWIPIDGFVASLTVQSFGGI